MIAGIWAAIRAWGFWAVVQEALGKFWRWLGGDLWRLAFVGALMVAAVQTLRIGGLMLRPEIGPIHWTLLDLPGWKPRALAAEKALADLQAQIKAAQPKAAEKQAAVNHEPAARSAAIAKASDHDAQGYYEKGRAAGAAYAAAHSLRASCAAAAGGGTNGTGLPGANRTGGQHDGPGQAADMVALSRSDYDTLTGNSLRLAKVHQDAQALIDAGVAVPDSSSPAPKKD
jgi:hypothetical protein